MNSGELNLVGIPGVGPSEVSSHEYIGYRGHGIFNQNGGVNNVEFGDLLIGYTSSGSGEYNLNNGELNINRGYLSIRQGAFNQYGGMNTVDGLWLGDNGENSEYNLLDGELYVDGDERIGVVFAETGSVIFNQSGGVHSTDGLDLGFFSSGFNEYNLNGGELNVYGRYEFIGQGGHGILNQNGGLHTVVGLLGLGIDSFSDLNGACFF